MFRFTNLLVLPELLGREGGLFEGMLSASFKLGSCETRSSFRCDFVPNLNFSDLPSFLKSTMIVIGDGQ